MLFRSIGGYGNCMGVPTIAGQTSFDSSYNGNILGGWASNSKYPFLGAIRSAAQMVSYEVSIGIIIINVLLCVGSLNLNDIVIAQKNT